MQTFESLMKTEKKYIKELIRLAKMTLDIIRVKRPANNTWQISKYLPLILWQELLPTEKYIYISNRIFLVADNDNTKLGDKKHERKEHLKQVLKENFYELPVIEIENLLSTETIKQILLHQNPNHKNVIEEKFKKRIKFKNAKVGKHIDDLFKDVGLKKYSEKSGTVRDKVVFCQTAIGLMTDYDMLTKEAKELVEKIVNFIKENN